MVDVLDVDDEDDVLVDPEEEDEPEEEDDPEESELLELEELPASFFVVLFEPVSLASASRADPNVPADRLSVL